jgi:hypothetical protein
LSGVLTQSPRAMTKKQQRNETSYTKRESAACLSFPDWSGTMTFSGWSLSPRSLILGSKETRTLFIPCLSVTQKAPRSSLVHFKTREFGIEWPTMDALRLIRARCPLRTLIFWTSNVDPSKQFEPEPCTLTQCSLKINHLFQISYFDHFSLTATDAVSFGNFFPSSASQSPHTSIHGVMVWPSIGPVLHRGRR